MRRWFATLAAAALALQFACAAATAPRAPLPGLIAFVWPRDGQVSLLTCRFETALPIGVALEDAKLEEETAVETVLRGWERAGLGLRFVRTAPEHAQIAIAFRDDPLAAAGRTLADCKLTGERAELARARVEIARNVAVAGAAPRPLARDELLGVLARELAHALGWRGDAGRGDAARDGSLADAQRAGNALLAGAGLDSPALRALYALPSGTLLARAPAEPAAATRPVDRLARLAAAHALDGPYLRTGREAGRVFWRDRSHEYGAQVLAPACLRRSPARISVALEARARRALPRSRDAAPD